MLDKASGRTCDSMGDLGQRSLHLKDCTPWKGHMLEQFVRNCSLWEGVMLKKFMEDCPSCHGRHERDTTLGQVKRVRSPPTEKKGV